MVHRLSRAGPSGSHQRCAGGSAPRVIFLVRRRDRTPGAWDTVIVGLRVGAGGGPSRARPAWRKVTAAAAARLRDLGAGTTRACAGCRIQNGMRWAGDGWPRWHPTCRREPLRSRRRHPGSALQRHAELTAEQRGTVALMHGERESPSFSGHANLNDRSRSRTAMLGSLRRGACSTNSRRLDNGNAWRYDAIRTFGDSQGDVDAPCPRRSHPCAAARRASSPTAGHRRSHRRATHFPWRLTSPRSQPVTNRAP